MKPGNVAGFQAHEAPDITAPDLHVEPFEFDDSLTGRYVGEYGQGLLVESAALERAERGEIRHDEREIELGTRHGFD